MNKPTATLPSPPHEPTADLAALEERVKRLEQMAQRVEQADGPLPTEDAMQLLGYKSGKRFWQCIKRLHIPYTRINQRRALFLRSDIEAVLRQRQVGTGRRRAA